MHQNNITSHTAAGDELASLRLIPFSEANRALGIKPQLAHDWVWKNKYPLPIAKVNGRNFVRFVDLQNHIQRLFEGDNAPSNGLVG